MGGLPCGPLGCCEMMATISHADARLEEKWISYTQLTLY